MYVMEEERIPSECREVKEYSMIVKTDSGKLVSAHTVTTAGPFYCCTCGSAFCAGERYTRHPFYHPQTRGESVLMECRKCFPFENYEQMIRSEKVETTMISSDPRIAALGNGTINNMVHGGGGWSRDKPADLSEIRTERLDAIRRKKDYGLLHMLKGVIFQ